MRLADGLCPRACQSQTEPGVVARWAEPGARGSTPASGLEPLSVGQFFLPLRRRWTTVTLLAVTGFATALLVAVQQAPVYRATALLEVQGVNDNFLNLSDLALTTSEHLVEPLVQTQVKILQSPELLGRVADKLELDKRQEFQSPQGWGAGWFRPPAPAGRERLLKALSQHLTVRSSGQTRIIEVIGESTDPKLASGLANTMSGEFIELTLARRLKNNQDTTWWLADQLRDLKSTLDQSEESLQQYARQAGLLYTSEKDSVAEAKLRQVQEALSKAQTDRFLEQARYARAAATPPDSIPEVLDDGTLKEYQVKLTDLKRQLAERSTTLMPAHNKVRELSAQISELEAALEQGRASVLRRIKSEYDSALNRERLEAVAYSAQANLVAAEAAKSIRYKSLKQEVDSNRQLYESTLQKVKEARIASAVRATNVQLLNAAETPELPAKPILPLYCAVGLFGGLFLGTALAFLQGSPGQRIPTPGFASFQPGYLEWGAVPYAFSDLGGRLASGDSHHSGPAEIEGRDTRRPGLSGLSPELACWTGRVSPMVKPIRAALTGVLRSTPPGRPPRLLVVTSALEGEGKTTIACNFALTLAQIRQRVLLIDAHLHRPRLHNVFGVPNGQGFSDLLEDLASQLDPDFCGACASVDMASRHMAGLHVLPSGAGSGSVIDQLHSAELPSLFASLRKEYDYIVIDTAPLSVQYSRPLVRLADGVVLVVGACQTSHDAASAWVRRLESDGTRSVGTVLNDRGLGRMPVCTSQALSSSCSLNSCQTT